MVKLRPHQNKASKEINQAWADGAQNVCAVQPTGSGKTVIFANEISKIKGYSFAFAHRQELIVQMSKALASFGVVHDIQAPDKLVRHIVREQMQVFKKHYYRPGARCIIGSVQTLINRVDKLKTAFDHAELMVTDECFPGDTLVDGKPISDFKIGDTVTAYDPDSGAWTEETVQHVFKNQAPKRMVWIDIDGHNSVTCTANHPVYTRGGWKNAGDITPNEEVLIYESDLHAVRCGGGGSKVFAWERVVGVSIQERKNSIGPSGDFVYNLEVSGPHTYTANGIVVHNCHHVLRENMWGRLIKLLPDTCRGLLVTATPERPDGKGLGRASDGIVDALVVGPSARELITAGYLTDYRIFGPYTDIDLSNVKMSSSTGDFTKPGLNSAVEKSRIVGDVVGSYLDISPGKIGITFVPGVSIGEDVAAAFNAAGVPAAMVHAKTPDAERQKAIADLGSGLLKEVVNVDLFGEGFDLPAVEVLSMARPTQSYVVYSQQFGRVLRIMDGKKHAIIIDHVQNVKRHGLPDTYRQWSLEGRSGRGGKKVQGEVPVRTCRKCTRIYQSWEKNCPYCGWIYKASPTATIEQVEGDIVELSVETLAAMRGEVSRVDAPAESVGDRLKHAGAPLAAVHGAMANHRKRQDAQTGLREAMTVWAGYQTAAGQNQSQVRKRFYATYGMDVITAQALGRGDAEKLTNKLIEAIK